MAGRSERATAGAGHLGLDPLKLRGFHDDLQVLWVKSHLVLSADDRISLLTQTEIAPIITFVVKCRSLKENLEYLATCAHMPFVRVMPFPQLCLPIPLRNRSIWDNWGRGKARESSQPVTLSRQRE